MKRTKTSIRIIRIITCNCLMMTYMTYYHKSINQARDIFGDRTPANENGTAVRLRGRCKYTMCRLAYIPHRSKWTPRNLMRVSRYHCCNRIHSMIAIIYIITSLYHRSRCGGHNIPYSCVHIIHD
jgi:hypothetical protein